MSLYTEVKTAQSVTAQGVCTTLEWRKIQLFRTLLRHTIPCTGQTYQFSHKWAEIRSSQISENVILLL